ncbi:MAG: MEMO1 family protein [Candidatus Micrarchaeota archaeon]
MRYEAFAGSFYTFDKKELGQFIDKALQEANVDKGVAEHALSFVAPHAGYIYSGRVAAYTYKAIELMVSARKIDTFIIIGPNHTGFGTPISISAEDWHMPFGIVKNDLQLSKLIAEKSDYINLDESAHVNEHSIEVQLPFLQKVVENPKCVFICMGDQGIDASRELAEAILEASKELGREVAVIASSDFNHYESAEVAKRKDMPAIEALLKLDYLEFNKRLEQSGDTACGFGPITVATIFAKEKGAKSGHLLKYANSGDANNDYSSVVAYASIIFA